MMVSISGSAISGAGGTSTPVRLDYSMVVVRDSRAPIVGKDHPGSRDNGKGYENGHVIKLDNGEYHMLITEMWKNGGSQVAYWVPARIGHWVSKDGNDWKRLGTIVEGNNLPGDPKEATWSPSWYWNEKENAWNIVWRGSNAVFRYRSGKSGRDGINGPYSEVSQMYPPFQGELKWKSYSGCGLASFSNVYTATDGRLYAFYGNMTMEHDEPNWLCALARADNMDGPWTRDPSNDDPSFVYAENPFIYKYDGVYFCVYDNLCCQHSIGYGYSTDGVHWVRKTLDLYGHTPWVRQPASRDDYVGTLRTPCSLIKEKDGTYTIFFTGYEAKTDYFGIGKISVKIRAEKVAPDPATEHFPADSPLWTPNSGIWEAQCGEYSQRATEKATYGSVIAGRTWGNFVVETQLRCVDYAGDSRETWGGIHFRMKNASDGPEDSGYLVSVSQDGRVSLRHGDMILGAYDSKRPAYVFRRLKVAANGSRIMVYLDDSPRPCIEVKDDTYAKGYIGLNASKSHWHFGDFAVTNKR